MHRGHIYCSELMYSNLHRQSEYKSLSKHRVLTLSHNIRRVSLKAIGVDQC